jgi:hypothetical protein
MNNETGEFSFEGNPDNVRVQYGPSVTIFGIKYTYPVGVYELPDSIMGCMVKIIHQNKWKMIAIIRDIATDHVTTLQIDRDFMGWAIENRIRKYRGMTDWEYLDTIRGYNWLPEEFMGGKKAQQYTALHETYTTTYSKDNSCWVYDSEHHQSPLYRSDTKPSFGHFREFVILSIAPVDEDSTSDDDDTDYNYGEYDEDDK